MFIKIIFYFVKVFLFVPAFMSQRDSDKPLKGSVLFSDSHEKIINTYILFQRMSQQHSNDYHKVQNHTEYYPSADC